MSSLYMLLGLQGIVLVVIGFVRAVNDFPNVVTWPAWVQGFFLMLAGSFLLLFWLRDERKLRREAEAGADE